MARTHSQSSLDPLSAAGPAARFPAQGNGDQATPPDDAPHRASHMFSHMFSTLAQATSRITGRPVAFIVAVLVVVVWAATGPLFHYSDSWQLVINTGTTIVTFLMVFMIQNTQNRDSLAVQLKLSELILAIHGARNRIASIEELSEDELEKLHVECRARAEEMLQTLQRRRLPRHPDAPSS